MHNSKPNQMPNELVSMSIRKYTILCILLPLLHAADVLATQSCYHCRGINCQRNSYLATEHCVDELDACVSVFQGGIVQAQGCLEQLEDKWRQQCESQHGQHAQCEICINEKCNNVSSRQLSCVQCLDTEDERCRTAPEQLTAQACDIPRSGRSFCYASINNEKIQRGCSLTLSEQRSCLADVNCQLCDPLEMPYCNNQLLEATEVTTAPPDSSSSSSSSSSTSTSSSTSSSTSTSTSSSTSSSSSTSTTTTTTPSPTPAPTPTPKPNSAPSISIKNLTVLLVLSQLLMCLYASNK